VFKNFGSFCKEAWLKLKAMPLETVDFCFWKARTRDDSGLLIIYETAGFLQWKNISVTLETAVFSKKEKLIIRNLEYADVVLTSGQKFARGLPICASTARGITDHPLE
jgi:hypothetical protein